MPSVSKAQQKFFGMVLAAKRGKGAASPAVAKAAGSMSESSVREFAKTKRKGMPRRVRRRPRRGSVILHGREKYAAVL